MKLHLLNGFLGSGKTTAIIAATRYYLKSGKRVGIVTNDKGRHLVDTAFFNAAKIPAAEVPGGCFRCNFNEFEKLIAQLQASDHPDIILAESVGSCVDLANTVFTPIQAIPGVNIEVATYSVFADIRLFQAWLEGLELPFSENIIYTFGKQIEEGKVLILNKMDLVSKEELEAVLQGAAQRFPDKKILLQNSLDESGVVPWIDYLEANPPVPAQPGFMVDYDKYSDGERQMAWVDRQFIIQPKEPNVARETVIDLVSQIIRGIQEQGIAVAHIKFFIQTAEMGFKLSFTTMDLVNGIEADNWQKMIPTDLHGTVNLLMNARLETRAYIFTGILENAVHATQTTCKATIQELDGSAFHPEVLG